MAEKNINDIDAEIAEVKTRMNKEKACLNDLRVKKQAFKDKREKSKEGKNAKS